VSVAVPPLPATAAGFWRRYAAWSLDWALLTLLLAPLLAPLFARAWRQLLALDQLLQDWVRACMVVANGMPSPLAMSAQVLRDPVLAAAVERGSAALSATLGWIALGLFGLSALYFAGFEASRWQATPGKRALRLRVRASDGGEAGLARALGRHLAGAISWLLLNLGHAFVAWRRDRRALHDLLAGTQVLANGPMPAGGRLWLLAQGALLIGSFVAALGWFAWQLWLIASA
jgi:uncharacterized RDD family membrane protein YckC